MGNQKPVTLRLAANTSTDGVLRALMATVGDLSTAVAETNAQQAQTTQHLHAVAQYLAAQPQDGGGARNSMCGTGAL